ncbi:MAG TPA: hypothetical protein PKD09_05985 [Aggregatilinea sp.]|uniref:hypothetical protein n=1 Tax=Aggregatilinea sp. TaxID=2806333 RepID=UPI002BB609C3|nr:hypothetical protein [Aggregatilinea sp.]HML21175.1 hypothetical protein [Aggregatilinea sp.]
MVLPNAGTFSYVVAAGETLVGMAAFFGCFMNANYLLAGSVSSNPALFILALLLVLAW